MRGTGPVSGTEVELRLLSKPGTSKVKVYVLKGNSALAKGMTRKYAGLDLGFEW